ncbi:MAG: ligand-binding sensor domain-containing protein, partial [Paraglaciecola sp.]
MTTRLYIVLSCLLFPMLLFGQSTNIGTPFIQNYFKKDYHGGLQTLDIVQSKSGVMYFANNDGLLTFNGTDWQLFSLPNKTNLRSIAIDESGKIYAGGQNEIGYFFPDSIGIWKFHSLQETLPTEHATFDDVWDICIVDGLVFFRTGHKVFIFKNDVPVNYFTIPTNANNEWISFLQKLEKDVYIQTHKKGLLKWNGTTFEIVKNGEFFIEKEVSGMLKMLNGIILIPTLKNGIFKYDGERFTPFATDIDSFLKENRIRDACLLPNNQIALGTNVAGLVILNEKGQPLWHLTKKRGLQNANIWDMFLDVSNNLWLGLDNGIDYVKTNSPFQIFYPDGDLQGTAYSAAVHKDKIYFGTSNGLYVRDWNTYYNPMQKSDFQLINGTRGQVWGLDKVNDDLFLGHHEGAFKIEDNQAISLNNKMVGTWTFLPDGESVMAGTYTGLQYFEEENNNWKYTHSFDQLKESSRIMVKAKNGDYWMAHPYRGVYKINLKDNREGLSGLAFFGEKDGLGSDLNNHVFYIFNRIIIAAESGLFRYDEAANKFVPDKQLNKVFGAETRVLRLFESSTDDVWYVTSNEVGYLKVVDSGLEKKVEKVVLPLLKEELVGGFEFILPLDKDNVFIGLEKGFIHYSMPKNNKETTELPVVLSKVVAFGASEEVLFGGVHTDKNQVIPNQLTNQIPEILPAHTGIRFTFSAPYFNDPTAVQYRYKLKGFEANFCEPSHKMEKEYTNLPAGTYAFQVSSKVPGGEWSESSNFQFEVLPPWYVTSMAMMIYGVLFLGLIAGLVWIPRKKYQRETEQLI